MCTVTRLVFLCCYVQYIIQVITEGPPVWGAQGEDVAGLGPDVPTNLVRQTPLAAVIPGPTTDTELEVELSQVIIDPHHSLLSVFVHNFTYPFRCT